MDTVKIPITKSARKFGYIIWNQKLEPHIKKLIGDKEEVKIRFDGAAIGEKNIDWKYHRISVGKNLTIALKKTTGSYFLDYISAESTLRVRTDD